MYVVLKSVSTNKGLFVPSSDKIVRWLLPPMLAHLLLLCPICQLFKKKLKTRNKLQIEIEAKQKIIFS